MQEPVRLEQHHLDFAELIQFTDTHIFATKGETFDGVDTAGSFKDIIEHAIKHNWPPDAVLITGDLVHEPVAAAYGNLLQILEPVRLPTFCLPGNHDAPDIMQHVLDTDHVGTDKIILFDHWTVFMLDTFLPDTHAGYLHREELEMLDQQLERYSSRHALVCLHHPPVPIGSRWMDEMSLDNPADFFAVQDRHPHVRGVIWGHIHQEFSDQRNGVMPMATPSTCVQFRPQTDYYSKDTKKPGYRYLKLYNSGKIETNVIRI